MCVCECVSAWVRGCPHLRDAEILARLDGGKALLLPRALVHRALSGAAVPRAVLVLCAGGLGARGRDVRELDAEVDGRVEGGDEVGHDVHLVEALHLAGSARG